VSLLLSHVVMRLLEYSRALIMMAGSRALAIITSSWLLVVIAGSRMLDVMACSRALLRDDSSCGASCDVPSCDG